MWHALATRGWTLAEKKMHTYLTTAEVAEILHVSPKTVTRWAREGKLPHSRTLGGRGIRGVAVFSEADASAKPVREADRAEPIGESPAPASYLNPAAIVEAGLRSGAQAVHPGYGFLSESSKLAEAVVGAGLS